ncbi:MAG: hypothetical protein J6U84_08250 [Bacteroidales bacterium]|nr:hypothetical protein [Bacteroidales bacterium]
MRYIRVARRTIGKRIGNDLYTVEDIRVVNKILIESKSTTVFHTKLKHTYTEKEINDAWKRTK